MTFLERGILANLIMIDYSFSSLNCEIKINFPFWGSESRITVKLSTWHWNYTVTNPSVTLCCFDISGLSAQTQGLEKENKREAKTKRTSGIRQTGQTLILLRDWRAFEIHLIRDCWPHILGLTVFRLSQKAQSSAGSIWPRQMVL